MIDDEQFHYTEISVESRIYVFTTVSKAYLTLYVTRKGRV